MEVERWFHHLKVTVSPCSSQLYLWVVDTMMLVMLNWDWPGGLATAGLHWEWSLNVVPPLVSIENRTVVSLCVVETLLVLATYSGKLNTLAIPLWKTITAHWEWRDGESIMYTFLWIHQGRTTQRDGYLLSNSAGLVHILEDPSEGWYM
jgi:hypothetical protein